MPKSNPSTTSPANSNTPATDQPGSSANGGTDNGAELVEVTPLGMSSEQMRKSNAQEVGKIEEAAAKAAVETDRQRLTDLKAAFTDDPAFAMTAYEAGHTVTEAKAERHDVLATANVELTKENADLKAKVAEGHVEFDSSDGGGEAGASTQSEDEVEAAAMKVWNANASLREEFAGMKSSFLAQ